MSRTRVGVDAVAQLLGDQLEPGRVRHPRRPRVEDLLGALRAVALAPAQVGSSWIIARSLRMPCISASGRGGQPGTWTSTGMNLSRRHDRVVVEHAHRGRAGAHRDRPLRLEHLVVDAPDDRRHLDRDAAREDQQVGLARGGAEGLGAEARDVDARGDDRDHLDRAAGEAEVAREERVRARPVERLVERRRQHALLDVLLEVGALELAAQHVAGAQLADAEVLGGLECRPARGGLPPFERSPSPHVDERDRTAAPTKTSVSPSANVPNACSWTATG